MDRKKMGLFAALGLGALTIIVLIVLLMGSNAALGDAQKGTREGFELKGTYTNVAQEGSTISFAEGQDGEASLSWQSQDDQGTTTSGYTEKTIDPNIYILMDDGDMEVGWIHLAYAGGNAEGALYLQLDMRDMAEMKKTSTEATPTK